MAISPLLSMSDSNSSGMNAIVAIVAIIAVLVVGYFVIQMVANGKTDNTPGIDVNVTTPGGGNNQ